MCGIVGIVDFAGEVSPEKISAMLKVITHRGPDSEGKFLSNHVGLGIRRLSIIDLKTGNQPIYNEDKTVAVVFNGEIYNFKELRTQLISDGHRFRTQGDTEVLVHLYEKHGTDITKYINGMFAFAIWDKTKNSLFLARDHAGIKPLYYSRIANQIVFASEPKSILTLSYIHRRVNPKALALFAYLGYVPAELSMFSDIFKLLPGHQASFSSRGLKITNYFSPNTISSPNNSLDDLINNSVKLQSFADVPLGLLLSGGLDSTVVAFYLAQHKRNVKSFSIAFSEDTYNEARFAQTVAQQLGTSHYVDSFKPSDILSSFSSVLEKLDEPLADPSLFPTYKVCRLARKQVKVALSGDGGDELFGGYPTYQGHILAKYLNWIPFQLIRPVVNLIKQVPHSDNNYPLSETAISFLTGLQLSPSDRHFFWMSLVSQGQKPVHKAPTHISSQLHIPPTKVSDPLSMQKLDFQSYLADDLLTKVDHASMYNSLEVRVPLLDPRIVKLAFSGKLKTVNLFQTKIALRRLLKGKFPDSVVNRRKKGFGIPLSGWLRSQLKSFAVDHLNERLLFDYFPRNEIDRLWQDHASGKQNNSKLIWMLVMFSAWSARWLK